MIPVDRDTSLQHNQFSKSLSLACDNDLTATPSTTSTITSPQQTSSRLSTSNSHSIDPNDTG